MSTIAYTWPKGSRSRKPAWISRDPGAAHLRRIKVLEELHCQPPDTPTEETP